MTWTKGDRNTGWEFDLLDREAAEEDDFMAQMGNYDTRHEAIGMKVVLERRLDYEYEVRVFESMWTELDEPVVCGWCGYEEWYHPLVRWYFRGCDESPFCSLSCCARWAYENDGVMPDGRD